MKSFSLDDTSKPADTTAADYSQGDDLLDLMDAAMK